MNHQDAKAFRKAPDRGPYGHVDSYIAKTGGSVLVTRTHTFYRASCTDCPGLAWSARKRGTGGTWPRRCRDCAKAAEREHSGNARFRVARLRAERRPLLEANRRQMEKNLGRKVLLKELQWEPDPDECSDSWDCECSFCWPDDD